MDQNVFFYRPQRSWGKVMFLHMSAILFRGGGVCHNPPPTPEQAHTLEQASPSGQAPPWAAPPLRAGPPGPTPPPWADTPWAGTPLGRNPLGRHPAPPQWADTPLPGQTPPAPTQSMLGYGQQAGGTHPTGIQSCFYLAFLVLREVLDPSAGTLYLYRHYHWQPLVSPTICISLRFQLTNLGPYEP